MSRPSIYITGAGGYIGLHTCKALNKDFAIDLGEFTETTQVVVHLGALIDATDSIACPGIYYKLNVVATLGLLEKMRTLKVDKIVFASSAAVYPSCQYPIKENYLIEPSTPYGRTKVMCEQIIADYARAYGIRYVNLRYFNVAGADLTAEMGENHDPETHLIPRAVRAAMHDLMLGVDDRKAVRDFVHVADVADANVAAVRHLIEGGGSTTINIGSGRGHSVAEVLQAVSEIVGPVYSDDNVCPRPGQISKLISDPSKAEQVLGWKATRSDLHTIIHTDYAWQMKRDAAG